METGASGEATTGAAAEETTATGVTGDAGTGQGQETGQEAATGSDEGATGKAENDSDIEVVEKDGKKLIPIERFNQVYGEMKQMKSFFEAIQSDPDARQKFVESLEGEKGEATPKETAQAKPRPTAFEQFLAQTPALAQSPEHQALFGNFGKAIADDLEAFLKTDYLTKAEVQKLIAPIMRYVGDTETSRFFEKNPQASGYKNKIVEVMKKHPSLSLEEAFVLSSATDNKIRKAGEDRAKQNQDRLRGTPITKGSGTGGVTTKTPLPSGNQGIAEGVRRAFAKLGIQD